METVQYMCQFMKVFLHKFPASLTSQRKFTYSVIILSSPADYFLIRCKNNY